MGDAGIVNILEQTMLHRAVGDAVPEFHPIAEADMLFPIKYCAAAAAEPAIPDGDMGGMDGAEAMNTTLFKRQLPDQHILLRRLRLPVAPQHQLHAAVDLRRVAEGLPVIKHDAAYLTGDRVGEPPHAGGLLRPQLRTGGVQRRIHHRRSPRPRRCTAPRAAIATSSEPKATSPPAAGGGGAAQLRNQRPCF